MKFMTGNKTGHRSVALPAITLGIGVVLLAVFVAVSSTPAIDASSGMGTAVGRDRGVHLDPNVLNRGCGACHKGHGIRGTMMLRKPAEQMCFDCHGPYGEGKMGLGRFDLYTEFQKPSNHPVLETAKYHVPGEVLPAQDPNAERHVACADCHEVHRTEKLTPMAGIAGYTRNRGAKVKADHEYEVCYLCHGDSANAGFDNANVMRDFSGLNASYHPVEAIGKNPAVPSLIKGHVGSNMIECTDCHGNDDRMGPQGPHGSIYAPLLREQYRREDGTEGPGIYGLCYECHDRRSILADESFRKHQRHIVVEGTSCATCHDAHGSYENRHLIHFNETTVSPSELSGGPVYLGAPGGMPRCYLNCHGVDHATDGVGEAPWPPGW